MGVELIPGRVFVAVCGIGIGVGCGQAAAPSHTVNAGGGEGGSAVSVGGTGGFSPIGAVSGAAGSVGGASGTGAGSAGASGSTSGPALGIAPHASHIACEDTWNFVVLADHSTYNWDYGGHVSRDAVNLSTSVSGAGGDTCFILLNGTLECLDSGNGVGKRNPPGTFTAVRIGSLGTGLSDGCTQDSTGHLTCWGSDYDAVPPLAQAPTLAVSDFDVGSTMGCAVLPDGSAQCWGNTPPTPPTGTSFASIYTNVFDTCALTKARDMVCSRSTDVSAPDTAQLAIGHDFACGIHTDGRPFCFGYRNGNPIADPPAGVHLVEIAVGDSGQACGVLVDGSVTCWGLTPTGDAKQRPPPDPIKVF